MSYILRRNEDGKFVAPPGSPKSYVAGPLAARRFPTHEAAQAEACGNETVVDLAAWAAYRPY